MAEFVVNPGHKADTAEFVKPFAGFDGVQELGSKALTTLRHGAVSDKEYLFIQITGGGREDRDLVKTVILFQFGVGAPSVAVELGEDNIG